MSDERFDRIETQISELRELVQQGFVGMMQDISGMKQDITSMKQNANAVREDVESLRRRIDSVEGTLLIAIRDGFKAQSDYADDLNYDLSNNERKTRRLSRRVARLERAGED
jgi:regulator of replication initiation timing